MKGKKKKKNFLFNLKFRKGIKINVRTVIEQAYKASKQHPPGASKDKLPLYDLNYANTFRNQKVFKPSKRRKYKFSVR